jgi:ABC-type nitrate/sulfonate/bicarbonate transport system substrate-binding protein
MKVRWGRVLLLLFLLVIACVVGTAGLIIVVGTSGDGSGDTSVGTSVGNAVSDWLEEGQGSPGEGNETEEPAILPTRRPAAASGAAGSDGYQDQMLLPEFRVLTLQYTPYMATLVHMAAGGYLAEEGYRLQLFDVYSEDVDLDEEGQCEAVRSGEFDALATTVDAVRKCGEGVAIAVPIGQSAGNDAIVVKSGVETWNDVFEHAIAFTSFSVSQYLACFASHSANQPMQLPLGYDDAGAAVDAWASTGAEIDIQSVVAWEPEVTRALGEVPGSRLILSSDDVRILWDVIEFSTVRVNDDPEPFHAFTRAYYRALNDLARNPALALESMVQWADGDEGRSALLTTTDSIEFEADLENEAFATLRDAAFLMEDQQTLANRLDEAEFYWGYCGVELPEVSDLVSLMAPSFVLQAREIDGLLPPPGLLVGSKVFQVTDFTDASAVTDAQIEEARVIFATGVDIEFEPNRTDFRDPEAANETLQNAVRFLRTCQTCVLEIQGGAAYPGERVCPGCRPEDSDELAVSRGRRVYDELRMRFDVPEAQLRFVEAPHSPSFPGSNSEEELRQDRRTFLTGYQLSGR